MLNRASRPLKLRVFTFYNELVTYVISQDNSLFSIWYVKTLRALGLVATRSVMALYVL